MKKCQSIGIFAAVVFLIFGSMAGISRADIETESMELTTKGGSSADYTLYPDTLSGGGGLVTSTDYQIHFSVAQSSAIIGESSSTDYTIQHGFWSMIETAPLMGVLNGIVTLERPGMTPPGDMFVVPLTVTRCVGGTDAGEYSTVTDTEGVFSVPVLPGTCNILVKSDHTLANRLDDVTIPVGAGTTQLDFGLLAEGDADNDNNVVSTDFFILRNSYNKAEGEPGYDDRADFNEDAMVTATDFMLLRSHYNSSGATCAD